VDQRRATRRAPQWLVGTGVIALAMAVMNISTYGFTIIAARDLGPQQYGALAALMGVLLVVNVVSLGLQATAARRVAAADPQDVLSVEPDVLAATYKSAVGVGVLCLLAVPLIDAVLRLDSWLAAALVAASAVPLTVMGGQAGILQGERRWLPLALVYLGVGVGRLVFGLGFLATTDTATGAMAGVALGAVVPVVIGSAAIRHRSRDEQRAQHRDVRGSSRRVLSELFHNSHALLAFFALSNADVIIARSTLDEHDAGLYAGGLILAKAVLFLPQFVVVVAFPSMSGSEDARGRMTLRATGMVVAIGMLCVAGVWALPGLAVEFIGGSEYAELEPWLWTFAVIGTIWATTQLLVYGAVARQRRGVVVLVWATLAVLLAVTLARTVTIERLILSVIGVEGSLLLVLVLSALRVARRSDQTQ
jgi:O-antigen/teichoic acid export membrane protein